MKRKREVEKYFRGTASGLIRTVREGQGRQSLIRALMLPAQRTEKPRRTVTTTTTTARRQNVGSNSNRHSGNIDGQKVRVFHCNLRELEYRLRERRGRKGRYMIVAAAAVVRYSLAR